MDNERTILVVDDVQSLKESLAIILEDEGYNVYTASNGLEALDVIKNYTIDLVVTDILMPEMDGLELVSATRQSHPDIQFIIISGGGRQLGTQYDYLASAERLTGIDTTLKKPFKPEDLIQLAERLLAEN